MSDDGTAPEGIDTDGLALTYEEHERLKSLLHGNRFRTIAYAERRYLVLGAGGDGDVADRRMRVYDRLESRPDATAFRLEDFELTPDELALWASLYEHLCDRATHVVLVVEDYEGGYVWEMGYLFHENVRGKVWVLKRTYDDEKTERTRYDNGMAASHLRLLENADRTHRWRDGDDLERALERVP
ncbi:hypothetical protein [Natrarchaeobius oligotrophus]|uniref:Uncharacterized protein n=1 Tax=Natrarchaeobius chitinivorans TaxID=1679083 RepID=A0A3N6NQX4_NATCH|nr:hypothetical protein [Natrarchaeobius chitinivorans]RQH02293.1 hypothetical protein EA472_03055 [Natrarchaeobius chitinivorans]